MKNYNDELMKLTNEIVAKTDAALKNADRWTRLDRKPKTIIVDGKEAVLL